ncbi:MAG: xanthine dehydrogenase family protein molybdopterin-binding subunit [Paracoccaceae bacterium]
MEKFGKSQSVLRTEDNRFLTGEGRYIDDATPTGSLFGYFFRSQVAHAEITNLDIEDAKNTTGVYAVFIAEDLEKYGVINNLEGVTVKNRDGSDGASPKRPLLAKDRVRFVGEPIALIVADSIQNAKDAAELIEIDYNDLPVSVDLAIGENTIHPEAPGNVAFEWHLGDEIKTNELFERADTVVSMEVYNNRIIANSMEPRGCYAQWKNERLHISFSGQGVWVHKRFASEILGLQSEQIRVTNPDVGGGFGMKAMGYPEEFVVSFAAIKLKKPVRWMSERTEAMLSDNAGRDLRHFAELAFDATNKIVAYRVKTFCNLGAYNSRFGQNIQTGLFSKVLMGVYDVQNTYLNVVGIYTNTTQVDAYRGAGRPEAIYLLERMMDRAARELEIDPLELRRINFIKKSNFPYQSSTGEIIDVGDFERVLSAAEISADIKGFERRKKVSKAKGRLRGLGLCYYIESILGDPSEEAKVVFDENDEVKIFVGTQSNGQGHETVFAQFLSDQTGIPAEKITVVQGDSDLIPNGGGTGGSRSVTVQNNATLATVEKVIRSFSKYLAEKTEVDVKDIEFDDISFRINGSNFAPNMLEVAKMASDDQRSDLLTHSAKVTLDARSFPNGAHFAEVEIDPETGFIQVVRYSVVDDFGNLINPMLAEGQVHGGVAQGIGQALYEHVVFDQEGQLLTATFMDYGMPRAEDLPFYKFETECVPSTANIMGMKGCGEAGTVGALAAVANAAQDALWDIGVQQVDMPLTSQKVWSMINSGNIAAE